MEELKRKAELLLEQCESVVLTSVDENGFPRPVPMSKVKAEGITTIWFATGTYSEKTEHFRVNPKAGVCFQKEINSVVLTGYIEIVTDEAEKKALWQDWFIDHFPGGVNDPTYCILKFTAKRATYWLDFQFVKGEV